MKWLTNGIPGLICITFSLGCMFLSGCATYHQKHIVFHNAIARGDYNAAVDYLESKPGMGSGKNKLVYYLDLGTARHLAGDFQRSNDAFEQAYLFIEDFRRNYALDALSFITNPAVVPYPGEDFEKVQIHYYKALNFALQGNIDDALVECRRINIKLNEINDQYEAGKKNRYSVDAFAWYFMGILFDVNREHNNAFICYRNALDGYTDNYQNHYGLSAPQQLKFALLKAARLTGLNQEYDFYARQFGFDLPTGKSNDSYGTVMVFWNNGSCPVKTEDSINFYLNSGDVGFVNFVSEDNNLFLPVPLGNHSGNGLDKLSFVRMALPRYSERQPLLSAASLTVHGQEHVLEPLQNIEQIALLNLEDRMGRELGTALLRVAIKQAVEQVVRKEDEALGLMVSVINAVSEQADTRNWQTLPRMIYCCPLVLPEGVNTIDFTGYSHSGDTVSQSFPVSVTRNKTEFLVINSPQSIDQP